MQLFKSRLFKNISYVFSGTALNAVLGLLNTLILVNAIGLEKNGIIFIGLSYAAFFNALFNFQSYDAVIKFLPSCMDRGNKKGKNYIQQAIVLDGATAIIAFVIAFLLVEHIGNYLAWDGNVISTVRLFTITILFTMTGAFTGVLRIFDEFKAISIVNFSAALFNLILYGYGYAFGLDINFYIYVTIASVFVTLTVTGVFTMLTLRKNGMHDMNFFQTKFDREFMRFAIYTNLSSTLDIPVFQLTPFIISKYLGLSDVAVYKIIERFGSMISLATGVIAQVIYPEISKLLSGGNLKAAYNMAFKLGYLVAGFGCATMVFVFFSHDLWLNYFIPDGDGYIGTVYFYLLFVIFTRMFIAQHPIFIYSGYVKESMIIVGVVNSIYVILLVLCTARIGLNGVILSGIVQSALIFLLKGLVLKSKKYSSELKVSLIKAG